MRIGIPVQNGAIYEHFGQATAFLMLDVENGAVVRQVELDASHTGGHVGNVTFLVENGATHVIATNIGQGATGRLNKAGVAVTAGVTGDPLEAARNLAAGTLEAGVNEGCGCGDHGHGHHHHGHGHHHE